jgi:hypothetical protein
LKAIGEEAWYARQQECQKNEGSQTPRHRVREESEWSGGTYSMRLSPLLRIGIDHMSFWAAEFKRFYTRWAVQLKLER